MKTFVVTLCAMMVAGAAMAAEFHPSTYTTYKKHAAYDGRVDVLSGLPSGNGFTEIGIVRVPTAAFPDYDAAISALKNKAAQHGGTAIVLQDDAILYGQGANTDSGRKPRHVSAIAIIN
ncbi:MAG: hypothetical protein MRY32_04670 [Rickettsiales bacterium]|nr:hypothetical protein [Rickettsiales bacterium]